MTIFIGRRDVERLFAERVVTPRDCIDAVAASFREHGAGQVGVLPRQILTSDGAPPMPRSRALKLSASYMRESRTMGASVYATHFSPGHANMWLLVFSGETGELDGVLHGQALSLWKTGATAAVAVEHLARRDATRAAIVGTGYYARAQLACLAAVRPLTEVRCYSRDEQRRRAFVEAMQAAHPGLRLVASSSAQQCVENADIVVTVTTSPVPVIRGAWLAKGSHCNAIGQHAPGAREIDSEAIVGARVFVDAREQAFAEKGEILIPLGAGEIDAGHVAGELGEVVAGRVPGRTDDAQRTVFCSGGTALEYMGFCRLLIARAREAGLGQRLDD